MRKFKAVLMSAALGLGLASGAVQAEERVFFGIATGGTGGTYYPLGGMLAQVISNNAELEGKKLSATAETGNASVANAGLLGRGDIESAFVAADILDSAYHGKNQFEGKALTNLRALGCPIPGNGTAGGTAGPGILHRSERALCQLRFSGFRSVAAAG